MDKVGGSGSANRDNRPDEHPGVSTSLEDLGDFCLASGEFTTAIEYFNKLLGCPDLARISKSKHASLLRRLATCYNRIGKCDHALELLDKAFVLVSDGEDLVELAHIIGERGWVHFKRGEYDLSLADLESTLDILLGDDRGKEIACTYNRLGSILSRKGKPEKAFDFFRAALCAARVIDERELVGACLNNLGLVCKDLGRWSESRAYLEQALEIAEQVGQHLQKGVRLNNLGIIYFKLGHLKKAYRCWTEALKILARIGNKWDLISVYLSLGHYHLTFRDFERAEEYYVRAMKESSDNGDARTSALAFEALGDLHLACDNVESAHRCYLEALEIAEEIALRSDVVAEVKRRLADVETRRGNHEIALQFAVEALQVSAEMKNRFEHGCSLRSKACAEFHLGEWEVARISFARALESLMSLGEKKELAVTYLRAGGLLGSQEASGDLAGMYLRESLSIFESLGMNYEAGLSALELGRIAAISGDVEGCHGLLDRVVAIFDGDLPTRVREEIIKIEREADERVSSLSIAETGELANFNTAVGRILNVKDQSAKLGMILDSCLSETSAERGVIILGRDGSLEPIVSRKIDRAELDDVLASIKEMLVMAEAAEKPLVSADTRRDGRFINDGVLSAVDGAVLCVPLALGEREQGCIYLDTDKDGDFFTRTDVQFVVALAGILTSVMSEAKLDRYLEENRYLRNTLQKTRRFHGMITQNRKMLEVLEAIRFLCRTSTTVLIEGETGTGKEMLARAIHASGNRQEKPFVTIDCSALSNEILESELFGHVKGAFTDARTNKTGLFEAADGGTVFLDEIDKTSRKFQERLLQVVDKREFKPVGSTISRKVDFRLICATNRDLNEEVARGEFLQDLYYRLKVISLRLPPLRERRDDIPILAEHFLEVYNSRLEKSVVGFSAPAMDLLVSFAWAGNVRQLEHEIERAVTFAENGDLISPNLFSDDLREWGSIVSTDGKKPMAEAVQQVEKQMIKEAMRRFNGNKTRAAKSLGLSRRGLLNKIQRYHIKS